MTLFHETDDNGWVIVTFEGSHTFGFSEEGMPFYTIAGAHGFNHTFRGPAAIDVAKQAALSLGPGLTIRSRAITVVDKAEHRLEGAA